MSLSLIQFGIAQGWIKPGPPPMTEEQLRSFYYARKTPRKNSVPRKKRTEAEKREMRIEYMRNYRRKERSKSK